jgi:hypothetical protein
MQDLSNISIFRMRIKRNGKDWANIEWVRKTDQGRGMRGEDTKVVWKRMSFTGRWKSELTDKKTEERVGFLRFLLSVFHLLYNTIYY